MGCTLGAIATKKFSIYLPIVLLILASCKSIATDAAARGFFPENKDGIIINDYSQLFSSEEKAKLSKKLYDYNIATTNQIVFVSINSILPYTDIQKYATDLGQHWGVGQKDKDNGLMLVLSRPLRQVGIATGYGTEKILTDSICHRVIQTVMIPHFKEDRYYAGLLDGLDSLMVKWK